MKPIKNDDGSRYAVIGFDGNRPANSYYFFMKGNLLNLKNTIMDTDITVKVSVSDTQRTFRFKYADLGLTKETWDKMDDDAKTEMLQQEIDDIPETPYWVVDTFQSS